MDDGAVHEDFLLRRTDARAFFRIFRLNLLARRGDGLVDVLERFRLRSLRHIDFRAFDSVESEPSSQFAVCVV